jgi:hypothetical protein
MAEAGRKHTAAAQRSKRGPPKRQTVVHSTSNPRFWELGSRDELESLASRREWKERLYDLINTHYLKTPLKERQWFNVLDLVAECARDPRTTEIDDEKRGRMVDFLCRAIYRGEFKDDKGRMQVANLHPSPICPIRLDLKRLEFDQLLAFAKEGYLFTRRRESVDCFARNNIDFPRTWVSSELTGPDTQDTPNEMPPTLPARHQLDKPSAQPPVSSMWSRCSISSWRPACPAKMECR